MGSISEMARLLRSRGALELDGIVRPGSSVDAREFRRVRKGAFVHAGEWQRLHTEDRHRVEIAAALSEMDGGAAVLSHESAAVAWNLPLYRHVPARVHVSSPEGHRGTSSAVVLRHRVELPLEDIASVDGVPVTSLTRTAFDVACTLPVEAALSCVDAAMAIACVEGHVMDPERAERWREDLRARADRAPGARGIRRARMLIEFGDGRAQLPGESVSRLFLRRLGFAPPRVQVPVPGPRGELLWIDLGLDDVGWWGEFDGKTKYLDAAMRGGRTVEEVVYDEKRREDWIRARTSRGMARWGAAEIRTLDRYATRLRAFGIHPPSVPATSRRPRFLL